MGSAMQLVPFGAATSLNALAAAFAAIPDDEFSTGIKPSFAVLRHSIGRSWKVTEGKDSKIIIMDAEGQPARSVDVIVIRTTPGLSNAWYSGVYDPDNVAPPDCYSNLGDKPAPDSKLPQAMSCAACPHAVWGPQPTDKLGMFRHGRACRQSKRTAVVSPQALDKPMLWSIPPDSFKGYEALVAWLHARGQKLPAVVVRLGFDAALDTLRITFQPMGKVPDEFASVVVAARESETAIAITGAVRVTGEHAPVEAAPAAAPAETKAAAPAAAPAETKAAAQDQIIDDLDALDAELAAMDFGTPV